MIFNFYLFNAEITEFTAALKPDKTSGANGFYQLQPSSDLTALSNIRAYFQKNKTSVPQWLNLISGYYDINLDEIANTSNSMILLIKVKDRIFAVTTGFGYTAIDKNMIEHDFGLKVVLNEINPARILKVDTRNLDTTTKQKIIVINRDSPLSDFEFDYNEEMISQLGGKPFNQDYGRSFYGSDSLRLSADLTLTQLEDKCRLLLNSFLDTKYRQNFAFYDLLTQEKSKPKLTDLEALLIQVIKDRKLEKISIAYPDINEINDVYSYKIYLGEETLTIEEISLEGIYKFLDEHPDTEPSPDKIAVVGLNANGDEITARYSLHDFLVFETDLDKDHYLLTLNRWLKIDPDYYQEMLAGFEEIKDVTDETFLPAMNGKVAEPGTEGSAAEKLRCETEGEYNERVAKTKDYVLLDKDTVSLGKSTQVEICDLLTAQKQFICVKKYESSACISHLLNQGTVSADLLSGESEYRKKLIDKIKDKFPDLIDPNGNDKKDITFVYAVASKSSAPLIKSLPFFSMVGMKLAMHNIEQLGYKVALYKIPIAG